MANEFVDPKTYAHVDDAELSFVQQDKSLHDVKFETKPVSYLRGCWNRFRSNKGSIVAGIILLLVLAFAIFGPLTSSRTVDWNDASYQYVLPKNPLFEGTGFWDGTEKVKIYETEYQRLVYVDVEDKPILEVYEKGTEQNVVGAEVNYYIIKRDTYAVGSLMTSISREEYDKIVAWQEESGKQALLPLVFSDYNASYPTSIDVETYIEIYVDSLIDDGYLIYPSRQTYLSIIRNFYAQNANCYYKMGFMIENGKAIQTLRPLLDEEGNIEPLYATDSEGNYVYYINDTDAGAQRTVRLDYNVYYQFKYGEKCFYLFGANALGYDIFVRLASGARLSLLLGVTVSAINLLLGLLWGAIAGYYGGTVDLVMERITDILSAVPFVIVATLFQLHLAKSAGPILSLLFAFVLTGWIGTASTTRMQFYRYKNQEYVLASRTLGAKDMRLIFVDILPNALGTLITSSVLMIPGVIFSESSLSYLNIIDLSNSSITSVGTLLNEGSNFISSYPHMILFPAIFISILMITFNLVGNGLRDAFNPTLRGEE